LAAGGTISIKRLSGERFVLLQRRSAPGVYDEVLALCRRAGNFSPHVVNEPDRMSTVLLLVESLANRRRQVAENKEAPFPMYNHFNLCRAAASAIARKTLSRPFCSVPIEA